MISNFLISNIKKFLRILALSIIKKFLIIRFLLWHESLVKDVQIILTSYPARYDQLLWTLLSLRVNTPAMINIVLYREDLKKIKWIHRYLIKRSMARLWITDVDLKSYKKIYPIIENLVTGVIIICDDDIFYTKKWYDELYRRHIENSEFIHGAAGHLISTRLDNNDVQCYNTWAKRVVDMSGSNILLTGAGGIIFKSNHVSKNVYNNYQFLDICPNNDDLWIHYIMFEGIAKKTTPSVRLINWKREDSTALYLQNSRGRLDDEHRKLIRYILKIDS